MKFQCPLIFLDCEMTGVNPVHNQLLEVSALMCDPKNFGVTKTFNKRVGLDGRFKIDDLLGSINKPVLDKISVSRESLSICDPPSTVIRQLKEWLPPSEDYIWVGYNLMLDFVFIRNSCTPEVRFNYRFIDITTLIELYSYLSGFQFSGYSLRDVSESLGIKTTRKFHSAENDVLVSLEVFKCLISLINQNIVNK